MAKLPHVHLKASNTTGMASRFLFPYSRVTDSSKEQCPEDAKCSINAMQVYHHQSPAYQARLSHLLGKM